MSRNFGGLLTVSMALAMDAGSLVPPAWLQATAPFTTGAVERPQVVRRAREGPQAQGGRPAKRSTNQSATARTDTATSHSSQRQAPRPRNGTTVDTNLDSIFHGEQDDHGPSYRQQQRQPLRQHRGGQQAYPNRSASETRLFAHNSTYISESDF